MRSLTLTLAITITVALGSFPALAQAGEGEGEGEGAAGEGEGEGAVGEGEGEGEGAVGEGEGEGSVGEGEGEGAVGEGEGEGEGEGALEGEVCDPDLGQFNGQGTCAGALVCVPDPRGAVGGTCRVSCVLDANGDGVIANDERSEDPSITCGAGTACLTQTVLGSLDIDAIACIPPATARDVTCVAQNDPDACPTGDTCTIADLDNQNNVAELRCKQFCDVNNVQCPAGESCADAPIQTPAIEDDGAGGQLRCDTDPAQKPACDAGDDANCPCDLAAGFLCQQFNITGGGTGLFCNKRTTQCGTVIPAILIGDQPVPQDKLCNEVDASRYCDQSMFDGAVGAAGRDICVALQSTSRDGICFPFCSSPSFDKNGNGAIEASEQGNEVACGAGFTCTKNIGRAFGIANVPTGNPPCDPTQCPPGQQCAACGVGDIECISLGTTSVCGAPFGSCEPGTAAGEGEGEGEGAVTPPPAQGCKCSSTSSTLTTSSPMTSPLTGVALLGVVALRFSLRRRR